MRPCCDELLKKICVSGARIMRSLKKPELRASVDVKCDVYPDDESDTPVSNVKINYEPRIKVVDLVLAALALRAVYRLLRELFKD